MAAAYSLHQWEHYFDRIGVLTLSRSTCALFGYGVTLFLNSFSLFIFFFPQIELFTFEVLNIETRFTL